MADALGTHKASTRGCNNIQLTACWAHVLYRFRDAVVDLPEAQLMLAWIQDLYRIDARATGLAERGRLRAAESRVVTEKMKTWMSHVTALKTTSLGGAVRYTLGIWDRLTLFLEDPVVLLDNNRTERGLRRPGDRPGRSLWVEVGARDRGRGDPVQPCRIGEGIRRRSDRVPDRGRDAGAAIAGSNAATRGFRLSAAGRSLSRMPEHGFQASGDGLGEETW